MYDLTKIVIKTQPLKALCSVSYKDRVNNAFSDKDTAIKALCSIIINNNNNEIFIKREPLVYTTAQRSVYRKKKKETKKNLINVQNNQTVHLDSMRGKKKY